MSKQKRQREEACYVCGHYHDYEGGVPCSICGHRLQHTTEKGNQPSAYPSEVLPGFLYLGSYDNASRSELLSAMGITHILNTVPSSPNLYRNSFTYHTVEDVPPKFDECNQFLDTARAAQTKVLAHCMSGITRSPTVVLAYLMHLRRWRLSECFKWLRNIHPAMQISPGDEKRLLEYEVQCLGSSSVAFGGLRLQQLTAGHTAPQPANSLFSWTTPSPSRQPQQGVHGTISPSTLPAAGSTPLSPSPHAVMANFSPGGSAPFVFGASPQ